MGVWDAQGLSGLQVLLACGLQRCFAQQTAVSVTPVPLLPDVPGQGAQSDIPCKALLKTMALWAVGFRAEEVAINWKPWVMSNCIIWH